MHGYVRLNFAEGPYLYWACWCDFLLHAVWWHTNRPITGTLTGTACYCRSQLIIGVNRGLYALLKILELLNQSPIAGYSSILHPGHFRNTG